jgi:uncharacterized protein
MSKYILVCIATILICINSGAQNNNSYDSALAKKLGADDYGMKKYVMAFLKTGPTVIKDSAARAQLTNGSFGKYSTSC